MKYFFDTEFIENGKTIDLISIGIVAEDGRTLYLQSVECDFKKASDCVWRNVFPHLKDFNMCGDRTCNRKTVGISGEKLTGKCHNPNCPWRMRFEIREAILEFCDPEKYGKPEIWGYYSDYDWVAFCQLFGTMVQLPKGFPMYCRDVKQLCDELGNPKLPEQVKSPEHNAMNDAVWTKEAYYFLQTCKPL